jgi:hypothetical protein
MNNEIIKIEELEVDDEILISYQSHFKYLKVLVPPKLSKTKKHWNTGQFLYENVRCSTRQDVTTKTYTSYNNQNFTRKEKKWIVTSENHNMRISQNLNDRQIWLIKREKQWNNN